MGNHYGDSPQPFKRKEAIRSSAPLRTKNPYPQVTSQQFATEVLQRVMSVLKQLNAGEITPAVAVSRLNLISQHVQTIFNRAWDDQ